MPVTAPPSSQALRRRLDARVAALVDLHFDPRGGSRFWLDRAAALRVDARREIRAFDDLARLGDLTQADLAGRRLDDLIPRSLEREAHRLIVGQTGGTTGRSIWTAYREDEFAAAFVDPFVAAAEAVGVPRGLRWLFVGPSGPHIIGKAMRRLAAAMGSADPFSVDFDPRWARTLSPGSMPARRYLEHVVAQALDVVREQGASMLFATPSVLDPLAERMTPAERERVRAVHYGGVAIAPDQMRRFQVELFPSAVHLSGYGNTLFGCCLELHTGVGRSLDYFPHGDRLILETIDERGRPAPSGRVRFTRLDETILIVRMVERDIATSIHPPRDCVAGFHHTGVRNPGPFAASTASPAVAPLY